MMCDNIIKMKTTPALNQSINNHNGTSTTGRSSTGVILSASPCCDNGGKGMSKRISLKSNYKGEAKIHFHDDIPQWLFIIKITTNYIYVENYDGESYSIPKKEITAVYT